MAGMTRRIGIIREGKVPPDRRVALTPDQCRTLLDRYPELDLTVQRSPDRAFTNDEYERAGIPLTDDLSDRDLIIGVKEVPIAQLLPGKTYLFFSHTIKKQEHNRKLLKAVMDAGITLLDHELLTNDEGRRVIAFGRWAGIVGAYNAFRAWQAAKGGPRLKPAHQCHDREEMESELVNHPLPEDLRIVITGDGRVGQGAMEVLDHAGIERVAPSELAHGGSRGARYTVLETGDIYAREDGRPFDRSRFMKDPAGHRSAFGRWVTDADIYIACHFWDPRGPKILTRTMLDRPDRRLEVVADISCDIDGPIDSTLRASTIAEPMYGYDPSSGKEVTTGTPGSVTVMAVDNLPCELPRDASDSFGHDLVTQVFPALLEGRDNAMVQRATIVLEGEPVGPYKSLKDWALGTPVV